MSYKTSAALYAEACDVIPGGVNSPVRAFRAVGGQPVFMERGEGAYLYDVDGNLYVDCVGSWGPLILGHAHSAVVSAIQEQARKGTTFGAPTQAETMLSRAILHAFPSADKVRLVSSGTEATMSAVRLARGFTGRSRILKFEGNYHGHADFLLARAGSGLATLGLPECAGVPQAATADTLTLPYNDCGAVRALFAEHGDTLACVIVEPVAGNMGCVPPQPGFLPLLREETSNHGAVLIFDEVMTGFRLAYGGAQERFGIGADLTTLGKIVGGGLPLGAFAGRADIMNCVAPLGSVYQAGTLSGNPVAVSAGLAALRILDEQRPSLYARLEGAGSRLADGLRSAAGNAGLRVTVNQVGSMLTVFFTNGEPVTDFASAKRSDTAMFARWFRAILDRGVYWPPSQFEAAFLCDAMTEADLETVLRAAADAFAACAAV